MTSADRTAVGRLAPSPSGLLHLGHARTFLLAYWHVRSQGGKLLCRIDDLDQSRSTPDMASAALRDLEWLGLDWDGEVRRQSDHFEAYRASLLRLVEVGYAYPCVCSRSDILVAQQAPHQGQSEIRYPGTCRARFANVAQAERASGKPAGLRFRVPPGEVHFSDGIFGPQRYDVANTVGDFLVAKRGGAASYQLAVVIDDALQGVTQVFRGEDLLPSTARQYLLQEALGKNHPAWFHAPLVVDERGRLAKRNDALSLWALRQQGVDPRSIVSWAVRVSFASAISQSRDRWTAREFVTEFDLRALRREPVATAGADELRQF